MTVNDGYINLGVCSAYKDDPEFDGDEYVSVGIYGAIIEEWYPQQVYQRVAKFDEQLINDVRRMIF